MATDLGTSKRKSYHLSSYEDRRESTITENDSNIKLTTNEKIMNRKLSSSGSTSSLNMFMDVNKNRDVEEDFVVKESTVVVKSSAEPLEVEDQMDDVKLYTETNFGSKLKAESEPTKSKIRLNTQKIYTLWFSTIYVY